MTAPHLPFPCLVEERLILRRERRFLLLQGPYALRVGETDGLGFRRQDGWQGHHPQHAGARVLPVRIP